MHWWSTQQPIVSDVNFTVLSLCPICCLIHSLHLFITGICLFQMFYLLQLAVGALCCILGMVSWLRMLVLLIYAMSMESTSLDLMWVDCLWWAKMNYNVYLLLMLQFFTYSFFSLTAFESWVTNPLLGKQWRKQASQRCLGVMDCYRYRIYMKVNLLNLFHKIIVWNMGMFILDFLRLDSWRDWLILQSTEEGIKLADEIGYPVMIKVCFCLLPFTLLSS